MPIHALAIVESTGEIHPAAEIGPFCVVRGAVSIGAGTKLHSHVTISGRTTIGSECQIFPGASLGGDPQDLKFRGEDAEVVIGDRCKIHECATVNKGTTGGGMMTSVGSDCLLMAYAHVAHDCRVADGVIIANAAQLAGHVIVGRKAIISGMVGVHHFASIGELSIIGAMGGVGFDIPPYLIAEGNPAVPRSVNIIGMRRDGCTEEEIEAMRDAYKVLYHDRSRPLSVALADLRQRIGAGTTPVHRLADWQTNHLEKQVKGRIQESHRPPVVGGAPNKRKKTGT